MCLRILPVIGSLLFLCQLCNAVVHLDIPNTALDLQLFEDVLDEELCETQLDYIRSNTNLLLRFLDTGIRVPRGILDGNTVDLGNYYKCLEISHEVDSYSIEGKYCAITIPLNQDIPFLQIPKIDIENLKEDLNIVNTSSIEDVLFLHKDVRSEIKSEYSLTNLRLNVAVCVPKVCTTQQAIHGLLNSGETGAQIHFTDRYCRLPEDRPWTAVNYIAIVIFGIIGLLTLLSTTYDINQELILKKDPEETNKYLRIFSAYTNTKRLLTFSQNPSNLDCVDGIRAIAMMWVVVGHSFVWTIYLPNYNPIDLAQYRTTFKVLWIEAALMSVDTFFMLSGLFLVYSTVGKISSETFIKKIPLFYLHRFLRLWPILATTVLLKASFIYMIWDGPNFNTIFAETNTCRSYWWSTLLFIQNFVSPETMCLRNSWYLSLDMQLYFVSPLVLYWVLGNRTSAWTALTTALLCVLAGSATLIFMSDFPFSRSGVSASEASRYYKYYYVNPLTRGASFFVGMILGYLLLVWKEGKRQINQGLAVLLWVCALGTTTLVVYAHYPPLKPDWDNQFMVNFLNTFMRPAWAVALGWMVFACANGCGGPINWFLCLRIWKLPSRMSYAIYVVHYAIVNAMAFSKMDPNYFSIPDYLADFLVQAVVSYIAAFALMVIIDGPCTTIVKLLLGSGFKNKKDD